jgi:hypothetical protein
MSEPGVAESCSSQIEQMMLEGLWEVIGQAGVTDLNAMARLMPPEASFFTDDQDKIVFNDLSVIQAALEVRYGWLGGQGIALQAGRSTGSQIFRRYGELMGLQALDFRLLPGPKRVRVGLKTLADKVSELCCSRFMLTEDEDAWLWESPLCPVCWQRQSEASACYFMVGVLQEFLTIISGGKLFNVIETECRAAGGTACIFRIDKQALEQ